MQPLPPGRSTSWSQSSILTAALLLLSAAAGSSEAADPPRYDSSHAALPFLGGQPTFGKSMVVCDVDADGVLDVVAGGQTTVSTPRAGVFTFRGDGFGNLVHVRTLALPQAIGVRSIGIGDVDGDGQLDLALANYIQGNVVTTYRGVGDGSFAQPVATTLPGASIQRLACGDVDGDGRDDVGFAGVFVSGVALSTTGGAFGPANTPFSGTTHAFLIDVDGDGDADPVVVDENASQVRYALATIGGALSNTFTLPSGGAPTTVRVGHLDGDGVLDLATCNVVSSTASLYRGLGSGTFVGHATENLGTHATSIAIGDVDADGPNDLVAVHRFDDVVSTRLGTGALSFGNAAIAPAVRDPIDVDLVDLDGDLSLDVVMLGDFGRAAVAVRGNRTPVFAAPQSVGFSGQLSRVADFDGDGIADLLAGETTGIQPTNLWLTRGLGGGAFAAPTLSQPSLVFDAFGDAADFDVDLSVDLLCRSQLSKHFVLRQTGGTFTALPQLAVPAGAVGASQARFADLDGDGDLDVVAAHSGSPPFVCTWTNVGNAFGAPVTHAAGVPSNTPTLATGDVDGDGLDDVVVTGVGTAYTLLRSTGAGFVATNLAFGSAAGGTPRLADLDGDQVLDLVVVKVASAPGPSLLAIAKNVGGGVFAAPVIHALPNSASYSAPTIELGRLGTGGSLDVVIRESDVTAATIAHSVTTGATPPTFTRVYVGQATDRIHVADVDGDGQDDIVSGGPTFNGVYPWAVVRETCPAGVGTHGMGCVGLGGFMPRFALRGCATPGGTVTLEVDRAPGGSLGLLMIGLGSANLPIGGSGCSLYVSPLLPFSAVLPLPGVGAGGGSLAAPAGIPLGTPTTTIEAQVFVADATSPGGFTTTNALTIEIE